MERREAGMGNDQSEMLRSPAYLALTGGARRVLDPIQQTICSGEKRATTRGNLTGNLVKPISGSRRRLQTG
jgi:hypothetical protein